MNRRSQAPTRTKFRGVVLGVMLAMLLGSSSFYKLGEIQTPLGLNFATLPRFAVLCIIGGWLRCLWHIDTMCREVVLYLKGASIRSEL